jgi:DNA-binding GntR family transcriptional regulator
MRDPEAQNEALQSFLYRAILDKIIRGEFGPGYRLVEEELARNFDVSRTPIREVLLAFQKDGLVERSKNRGARVVSFTADDVEELYDMRKALEVHCVEHVVRTVKLNELAELERRLEVLSEKSGRGWRDEHARIDIELHHLIVKNSGNRRLIAQMKNLSLLIESLQFAAFNADLHIRETGEQHLGIVRALLARNVALAERLLGEHIETGKRNAIELFLRRPQEMVSV